MATHSEFLTALVDALGADRVQVGDTVPARHHTDWSGTPPVPPLALVRPRSTEEVSALLRLCHAHRVPVVPQGGLTGLAGAAVPCVASTFRDTRHASPPFENRACWKGAHKRRK